jgi:hypothetical protein
MGLALRNIATGALALALAGCSGNHVASIGDSGTSSPPDSTTSRDAGPDATADAGPDVASISADTTTAATEDAAAPDADAGLDADATGKSLSDSQPQSDATSLDESGQVDVSTQPTVDSSADASGEAAVGDASDLADGSSLETGSSAPEAAGPIDGGDAGGATAGLLEGRSGACLTCGTPCIDPNQTGFTCDGFSGTQLATCLQILGCALGANCGTTAASPSCLCGAADAAACSATASPTGPCEQYYVAAFDGGSVQSILAEFADFTSPVWMANQIVACLQTPGVGCPSCF